MANRVAVLSDIHGVLPALEAVLSEPDVAAADLIVVTGDIASGPQPREVVDRLLGLGERVAWVRGNADRARTGRCWVPASRCGAASTTSTRQSPR
jgi:predicted phosphodiesterase